MTTKELIKLLQEADPSGDSHVRMDGGIPISAYALPGYYDGPYSYLEEVDGVTHYVVSREGSKVDIITTSVHEFITDQVDIHESDNEEKVLKRCQYKGVNEDRITEYQKNVRKIYQEEWDDLNDRYQLALKENKKHAELGWRWFQNKLVDQPTDFNQHVYFTWLIFNEKGGKENSNVHNTEGVLYSGNWTKISSLERPEYYEWVYNERLQHTPAPEAQPLEEATPKENILIDWYKKLVK